MYVTTRSTRSTQAASSRASAASTRLSPSFSFPFTHNQGIQERIHEALYVFTLPNVFYLQKKQSTVRVAAREQVNASKGMVPRGMKLFLQGSIVTKDVLENLKRCRRHSRKKPE